MKSFPVYCRISIVAAALCFSSGAGSASAEAFSRLVETHEMLLEIKQAYHADGSPNPIVSLNGATLREFSDMHRLTVVFDQTAPDGERIVVLHHWQGGNGCAGALTLFSLSNRGFLQSEPLAKCVENYSVEISPDDADELKISAYTDSTRAVSKQFWLYIDGEVIAQ